MVLIEAGDSQNRRTYPPQVLARAAHLFENVKAFADHPTKDDMVKRSGQRSVREIVLEEQAHDATISQTQVAVLVEHLGIAPDEAKRIVTAITTTRSAISNHRRTHKLAQKMFDEMRAKGKK